MKTPAAQVHIEMATLAGGHRNQDRHIVGDSYAAVLDGASSFARTRPHHDGAWYADNLARTLERHLSGSPEADTAVIVARAIADVAQRHGGHAASCPTSTLALTRWTHECVEVYVLGDSTVAVMGPHGEDVHTDVRLDAVAPELHREYRERLRRGHGFDETHRELLAELQQRQAGVRNTEEGYWIAGADPAAAHHAYRRRYVRAEVDLIVMATDGAASIVESYAGHENWRSLAAVNPRTSLQLAHDWERRDPRATRWPRSKAHDDKTLLILHP